MFVHKIKGKKETESQRFNGSKIKSEESHTFSSLEGLSEKPEAGKTDRTGVDTRRRYFRQENEGYITLRRAV